ncbi:hypothetical protein HOO54_02775 [Bacillus sp. WMMC1349]|nr:hypothetical protein [Bacillus sp. WMMC1349]NPC91204.1 hypothetical protein [Bacillus sp. WMMC1349]
MKECSNCGDEFQTDEGYPTNQKNRFECCCSLSCWLEFIDEAPWKEES